jgi:hypothetical protein
MLAWIFWHSRFTHVSEEEYRATLAAFHATINAAPPEGFLGFRTLRYESVPWLSSAAEVFEDWHLLHDSAALDRLDDAAIAALRKDAHTRIARLAATATAGLYRLRAGSPLPEAMRCTWLDKPRGESYETFIASLKNAAAVWSRQMVLGPTPEFCIESRAEE